MAASFDDPHETTSPAPARPAAAQDALLSLEPEQAFLTRLFEALPHPVSYIDSSLIYRQCNAAAAATVGRTPEEVVGQSVASVVGADSEVIDLLGRVLASGEPYSGIVEFTVPGSESPATYRVSYLPDIDAEGKVIGVLTNVVDVTELVRGEQALRASEDRLRRIARAGRIGFVEYNVAADDAYWSPEHYELFGFEEGTQVDWRRWLEGVHPEDRERVEANAARLLERAAAEGRVRGHTDEYRFVRSDGTMAWIEADMAADMVDGEPIVRGVVRDVTERKRMEGALQESEEQNAFLLLLTDALRQLADPVAVQETASRLLGEHLKADRAGYFEIDGDECVIERDWAPSVPHLTGRFRGAAFGDWLVSAYRSGRMVAMNNIADEPLTSQEREAYSAIDVAALISIPLIKDGKFVGGLTVHSSAPRAWTPLEMRLLEETAERTWAAVERAKAESELREGEERYRQLFESESDALLLIDQETGRILEVNAAAEALYGYDAAEMQRLTDVDLSAEPQETRSSVHEAAAGERVVVPIRRHRRRDGSTFIVEISGRVFSLHGRPVRIAAVRDVSERLYAEEALREGEERFRSLLWSSRDVLYRVDLRTGMYDFISPSVEPMTGFSAEELTGMPREASLLLVHPDDVPGLEKAMRATDEIGEGEAEYRQRTKSGEYRWLSNYMVLVRDAAGVPVFRIGNIRDVTAQRDAETALREHDAEKVAQEERANIARNLHDSVTQSLFAATLKAEALTIASSDEAPGITAAAEEVRRLSRGALAQMRTLLLELRGDPVEEVPLHQLLRNLIEAAESRASVQLTLTLNGGSALPPKVHEAVYRIAQEALNNVVRHAKASNAWVRLDVDPSQTRLLVGDDGCGFDPDASVDPSHFGLRSMKERAGDSGGCLAVRSVQGDGTVVTALWPCDEPAELSA